MKISPLPFLLISFLIFSVVQVGAQKSPMKFGKLGPGELEMKTYEADPDAEAVILGDYATSKFDLTPNGWKIKFEHHRRIKILSKDGYDWANVKIKYYDRGISSDKITSLKAVVHNLENGQAVSTKVGKDKIFDEEESRYWSNKIFTFPNVKVGSIIEYSYVLTSDNPYSLKDWEFQKSIPSEWSEYIVEIPEYFNYKSVVRGYLPFTVNHRETKQNVSIGSVAAAVEHFRWAIRDVPAFESEPFITSSKNYIAMIKFELKGIKYPGMIENDILNSWEKIDQELLEYDRFGVYANKSSAVSDQVQQILASAGAADSKSKMIAIYNHVRDEYKFNTYRSLVSENTIKKTMSEGTGNSADLNLLLVAMLKAANLNADPVIISTRKHGYINTMYPMIDQFDYTICYVDIDGDDYLLDVTDDFCSYDVLPEKCINGEGRVIRAENPKWVNLVTAKKSSKRTNLKLDLNESGILSGSLEMQREGYNAISNAKDYDELGSEEYIAEFTNKLTEWQFSDVHILDSISDKNFMRESYKVDEFNVESSGDRIYLNSVLLAAQRSNPFKLEARNYPVDFAYPRQDIYMLTLTIPDNYEVEELPVPAAFSLPDKSVRFKFFSSQAGSTITILSQFKISQTIFYSDMYPALKEMFNQVIAKQSEQIVLKRKSE